jgi:hypothetical protein
MAMSIAELDTTVRTFYEGRGEAVGFPSVDDLDLISDLLCSKSKHKTPSTRSAASYSHSGLRLTCPQFKENPDSWTLVDTILKDATYPQTKCRLFRYSKPTD